MAAPVARHSDLRRRDEPEPTRLHAV